MLFVLQNLAQSGARAARTTPWLALLFAACSDAHPAREANDTQAERPDAVVPSTRDASTASTTQDASTTQPEVDSSQPTTCEKEHTDFAAFLAANGACSTDADCKIIGDCNHAGFRAVAASAYEEGQKLATSDCFSANDGPGYYAVCNAGKCEASRGEDSYGCGSAPATACQPGAMRLSRASCGTPEPGITSGCLATCENGETCPGGTVCRSFDHDPCARPDIEVGGACPACEGIAIAACLPPVDCEVVVTIDVGREGFVALGGPGSSFGRAESFELDVVLINRSASAQELTLTAPCLGPQVDGLDGNDVWKSCLAGACAPNTPAQAVSLAPGERKSWRSAVVSITPNDCNPHGIAAGSYTPTVELDVQGARVCTMFTSVVSVTR